MSLTHAAVLRENAAAYPDSPALRGQGDEWLTYPELDELTTRVASVLLDVADPDSTLIYLDHNSIWFNVLYYATAKAGMRFAALNYWYRPHELQPQLELLDPSVVVAGEEFTKHLEETGFVDDIARFVLSDTAPDGWRPMADLKRRGSQSRDLPTVDEQHLHEIVFTSGTTGQAKGVMQSQRARILDSMRSALAFEVSRRDHLLWFLPQFHVGGAAVANQFLVQGGRVTVIRKFDAEAVQRCLDAGDVTYMVGVPAHYRLLFEHGVPKGDSGRSLRGCYVGGSVASHALFQEIEEQFPNADLVHGYGSTESGPHSMALRGPDVRRFPGALGLPVPGSEVRVVDPETLTDVPRGEPGELWVRSESVMTGYLKRPELTAETVLDGWLRTGDLVRVGDGGYYYLVDRYKDMIITGGENVYAKEVEGVLTGHDQVIEAAVIGIPDRVYEERVVALVRTSGEVSPDELREWVRSRLAGYKVPRDVKVVEDYPRTPVGKIAKHELREQYGSVFSDSD